MNIQPKERSLDPFSTVPQGTVFLHNDDYYMKTSTAILSQDRNHTHSMGTSETHFKAVRLKDGQLCNPDPETLVAEFPDAIIKPGQEA